MMINQCTICSKSYKPKSRRDPSGCLRIQKTCSIECGRLYRVKPNSVKRSRFYTTWINMLSRCYNEKSTQYKWYGARGIQVCLEWRNSSAEFIRWCEEQNPHKNHSLDRINNNDNYYPSNCKFSSQKEQSNNTRSNVKVQYNDENLTQSQFISKYSVVSLYTFQKRKQRGWTTLESALTPIHKRVSH